MPKKIKVDSKKLEKPDEFYSFSRRLVDDLTANWKRTILIAAIIFGGLAAYTGIKYYNNYRVIKAQENISRATAALQEEKGSDAEALTMLEKAAKRAPNKATGQLSHLYLGNHFFKNALYDRALKEYDRVLSRDGQRTDPLIRELALMGAGYTLEQMGKCPDAIKRFEEASKSPASIFADSALLSAARCQEQQGNLKAAFDFYKRVEAEHPDSPYLSEARSRLDMIRPAEAAQGQK